jgi:hypothetical protein
VNCSRHQTTYTLATAAIGIAILVILLLLNR